MCSRATIVQYLREEIEGKERGLYESYMKLKEAAMCLPSRFLCGKAFKMHVAEPVHST